MHAAASERAGAAQLARGARDGDPHALGMLYDVFGAGLFRLAYRLTGTREDAEDVVHDVFVGLPEALGRYEERGRLGAWLRRVTARVALMRLRDRARRRETGLEGAAAVVAHADATPDRAALQAAVDALPADLRGVLVLKEMEGYSHVEVAELLGISVVTSRVRLFRALRRVRRQLEEDR
ncbi:MAG TPA: sigma-70 family RNA polymerase sigma factor [Gemmatimonadales bacterium]|jgi:RNA polymerase sigma-70 factor (ECF subfamily)|nr:sigma-70 family RNA polymerase sigma factor [Gemmatimonadales bacterium]